MRPGSLLLLATLVLASVCAAAWWMAWDESASLGRSGAGVRAPSGGAPARDGTADVAGAAAIVLPPSRDAAAVAAPVAAAAESAVPLAVPRRRALPNPEGRPRLLGRVTRAGAPAEGLRVVARLVEVSPEIAATEVMDQLFPGVRRELEQQGDAATLSSQLDNVHSEASYWVSPNTSSGADGRFVLPLPLPGSYVVWLQHDADDDGRWFASVGVVVARGEALELDLALPTGRLVGQLVHAVTGEPLRRALYELLDEPWAPRPGLGSAPRFDPRRIGRFGLASHVVRVVDGEGLLVRQVLAHAAGRFEIDDLPDGRYRVGVDRLSDEVAIVDGQPSVDELVVPVRPPARVRGFVRRLDGRRSFRRESVLLVPEQVPPWERVGLAARGGWPSRSTKLVIFEPVTAEQQHHRTSIGSFDFDGLPPGRYRLAVGDDLTAEQVLASGTLVDASLGGLIELTLVTED